jgi:hypothetical protein
LTPPNRRESDGYSSLRGARIRCRCSSHKPSRGLMRMTFLWLGFQLITGAKTYKIFVNMSISVGLLRFWFVEAAEPAGATPVCVGPPAGFGLSQRRRRTASLPRAILTGRRCDGASCYASSQVTRGHMNGCSWHDSDLPRCPHSGRYQVQSGPAISCIQQAVFMSTRPSESTMLIDPPLSERENQEPINQAILARLKEVKAAGTR